MDSYNINIGKQKISFNLLDILNTEEEIIDINNNSNLLEETDDFDIFIGSKGKTKKAIKYELFMDINKNIIKNTYDDSVISFDYDSIKNNLPLLPIEEIKETIIKTYIENSIVSKSYKYLYENLHNSYKTVRIIASFLKYNLILYDSSRNIIDNIAGEKAKHLCFFYSNNKIYPLAKKLEDLQSISNIRIKEYKKRDIRRNDRYVLIEDIKNYKNYFIKYRNVGNFKYKYLVNSIDGKKPENLLEEDIKILVYLINNFGQHFYLIEDYLKVPKDKFNLEFAKSNSSCIIPDFPKIEYDIMKDNHDNENSNIYYYTNDQFMYSICGKSIEEIKLKAKSEKNLEAYDDEIRKILFTFDMSDITCEEDIAIIKELYTESEFIYYTPKKDIELIISTKKINLDNIISPDYVLELYNKNPPFCKLCKCPIDLANISIDAINPMFGHTIDNIQLLCYNCNIFKNTRFMDRYSEKPYYYDINKLERGKLIEIMKCHKLNTNGITYVLRKNLQKFIEHIDD